jgi:hypothetical protein
MTPEEQLEVARRDASQKWREEAHRLVIENRGCKETGEDCTRAGCGVTVASCEAWREKIARALEHWYAQGQQDILNDVEGFQTGKPDDTASFIVNKILLRRGIVLVRNKDNPWGEQRRGDGNTDRAGQGEGDGEGA